MNQADLHIIYTCFPEGKHKVLTMSYDDGRQEDKRLVALFNEYGIKGTFHVNAGLTVNDRIPMSEYKELYKGHEVSCHTFQHPTIARCPMEQIAQQVIEDRKELESIMGYPVRGLSYPNGSYNAEIANMLPNLGIRYSRTVTSTKGFAMSENFLTWNPTCHHNENLQELGQEFVDLHKTQYLYLMYVWGHSYEYTRDDNWSVMENFCKLVAHKEDIWYATNIQIVDYMEAAKRMQYSAKGDFVYNPSVQSVWVEVDKRKVEARSGEITKLF